MADKQAFLKQFDSIPAVFPIQGTARAEIHNGLDFPTIRDEYWKYTRVNSIIDKDYLDSDWAPADISLAHIEGLDTIDLVFVNGVYSEKLSSVRSADSIVVSAMSNLAGELREQLVSNLGEFSEKGNHAFNTFNTSYFRDGAFVLVKKGTEVERPIRILNLCGGNSQANNLRNMILVEANAKVQIISQSVGEGFDGGFNNAITEIKVGEGASMEFYLLEDDGENASTISSTYVYQQKSSNTKVVTLTKSGRLVRNNLNFDIDGQGCEANMYGIYFTTDKQHVDNHTYADHKHPNCNSNELYKGVMAERSTGVFNGKIMVRQDAQKTNAFQSNQNILLSDNASINTKPELEIYADDVKCSHGCTVGQLDDEALFYLRSRGLDKLQASKLLIEAFAGEVLEEIEVPALRDFASNFIHEKFAELDA